MSKLYNLARMTTATTGTGTITLGSAVASYLTFAQAGVQDGDTITYAIADGAAREIGTGTYTASGTTLTRSVLKSTNSDAAINLSGSAEVFITPSAEDLPLLGEDNVFTGQQTFQTADSFGSVVIFQGTNAGSGGASALFQHASASPANFDTVGAITFQGNNDAAEMTTLAEIFGQVYDVTDASEDGHLTFRTTINGTAANRFHIGAGAYMEGATGFDQGAGTFNATGVYVDGNDVLARANHTGTQTLATISDSGALAALDTVDTAQIDDDAVTYAKMQNVSATDRLLGRDTAGAGVVEEIAPSAVRTMLNVEDGATANSSDATLLARTNHTGTQAQSTIVDLVTDLSAKAPLASPTFTGTPAAPTASGGTDTTQIATTAFVQAALSGVGGVNFTWQRFTASGTWNKPADCTLALVLCIAAGGGGGGADNAYTGGAGGGAGETAIARVDVSAISSRTVTIGSGGSGGSTAGGNGSSGGNTSWGTESVASGGAGGAGTGGQAETSQGGLGGSGGTGDILLIGGDGGGGQGSGAQGHIAGVGGASLAGGGGRGYPPNNSGGNGSAGRAYGSGGGGGGANNTTGRSGGSGADGYCLVLEFYGS